jgi:thioredoxin reductase
MKHDIIIIGGSYAGISAGLHAARARRRVLVIDSGERRNRFAAHAHGLVGMDGVSPAEIAALGRQQLLAYPTVEWREGVARSATGRSGDFVVTLADGKTESAKRLILATGVRDELPPVPGLRDLWGTRVFHCPYCHGYELEAQPAAVLATSELSVHHALMLPDWGPTTLLLNDVLELTSEHRAQLDSRGVSVVSGPVERVASNGSDIQTHLPGQTLSFAGLFVLPRTVVALPLVESLGCALEPGPTGSFVKVDARQQTSVPGVFACGDIARAMGALPFAAADGTAAGVGAHASLIFEQLPNHA